jgi:hypothetical protein
VLHIHYELKCGVKWDFCCFNLSCLPCIWTNVLILHFFATFLFCCSEKKIWEKWKSTRFLNSFLAFGSIGICFSKVFRSEYFTPSKIKIMNQKFKSIYDPSYGYDSRIQLSLQNIICINKSINSSKFNFFMFKWCPNSFVFKFFDKLF